ncbi:MAG: ATP-binding protein, partial [Bacteroidota bacterium]
MEEALVQSKITRHLKGTVKEQIKVANVLLVQGPKGIGKTEFILDILSELEWSHSLVSRKDYKSLQGEEEIVEFLSEKTGDANILVLKDAEHFGQLQMLLELVLASDNAPRIVLLSSFQAPIDELLFEALKANDLVVDLTPFSFYELAQTKGMGSLEKELEDRLVFGSYPAVVNNPENAEEIINELLDQILVTQLGANDRINKKKQMIAVLKTLAFEMGEVISYNDIGTRCDLDNETVERYVELFEKAFLIYRIPSYYGGNKYEMKKGTSVYFADNGLRNALINNFNSMEWRNDATQLWRNWLLVEKIKWNRNLGKSVEYFTWKTHTKQNVDCIEIENGRMRAYQTSWTKKKTVRFPAGFLKYYPDSETFQLNKSTY